MDVSKLAEVAAALSGGLGTPTAVWLAFRAWRREGDRAREDELRRRRLQPGRVVVRTEAALWPRVDGEGSYPTRVATVVNASDEPVFDVSLFWHEGEDLTKHAASRVALLPGESWQVPMPTALAHTADCEAVFASIWFFDVEKRGWRRGPRGTLEPVREYMARI